MKAVLIVHNTAIDDEVDEALSKLGVVCYTKFTNVLGKGTLSGTHLNTAVWPGVNCATLVVVEQAKAKQIIEIIRQMRQTLGPEGLKAFAWEIEEIS